MLQGFNEGSNMQELVCPKCGKKIRLYPKDGYYADLNLAKSNENVTCHYCKRKISYSIQKSE